MDTFAPEGKLFETYSSLAERYSAASLRQAAEKGEIMEAVAVRYDNTGSLTLELGGAYGTISHSECTVFTDGYPARDVALSALVGKPVCFKIADIFPGNGRLEVICSRRAAQKQCTDEYIARLRPGDIISCRATRLEPFGVFADVGCGIPALLPVNCICVSRLDHPSRLISPGAELKCAVKSVDEQGRLVLTQKELFGSFEQNAAMFAPGETALGTVRAVEDYGVFIELAPNFAGLAEYRPDVQAGDRVSVYIKSIIPEKLKVKLAVIENLGPAKQPPAPRYFIESGHLDYFRYSPVGCARVVETYF